MAWKAHMAALVRRWPFSWLLVQAVRFFVPRQRVGVALVALNDRNEVFMLKHVYHPDVPWGLPGGWLGRDEAPATALAREIREETGLTADIGEPLLVRHVEDPAHIILAYTGHVPQGNGLVLSAEILDAGWFPLDSLPQPLHPFTLEAIAAAQSQPVEAGAMAK